MKLQEIFDQLSVGEFSQQHIGGGAGGIQEEHWLAAINHVSLGLAVLYRRFPIKNNKLNLLLHPDILNYHLVLNYADSNKKSKEAIKYIKDTPTSPFLNDVQKIERVTSVKGVDLPLNNISNKYSLYTPSDTLLRVPEVLANINLQNDIPDDYKGDLLLIEYRANHPNVIPANGYIDPTLINVELPYTYLNALLLFIASRLYGPVAASDRHHIGDSYAAKFERECQQLTIDNAFPEQGRHNTSFVRNGWV